MERRPIGIFDSGIGGLTVLKEIARCLPNEDVIYFGDTARVPYGAKSKETVTRFSKENIRFLLRFKVKLVVVACNTASSLSLPALIRMFTVPIIGVIKPGVDKALEVTKGGPIGVIGTRSTIASGVYQKLLKKRLPKTRIIGRACPLFVPLVEEGWINDKNTLNIAKEYLKDFKKKGIETLILGCTHYPLLKPVIRKVMGVSVKLVDSAEETARTVKEVLVKKDLLSGRKNRPANKYFVTDEPSVFKKTGERFLGRRLRSIRRI